MDDITLQLKRLRRRIVTQLFIERLTWCLLALAAVSLLAIFGNYLRHAALWDAGFQLIAAVFALVAALAWTWSQRPSLGRTASLIDRLGNTRDRFLTALSFSEAKSGTPMQASAIDECRRFIASFDGRPLIKLRVPAQAWYLFVPLAAAGLLFWQTQLVQIAQQPDAEAQRELGEKSRELEKLARQIEGKNAELKSDELKKIADELKKSAAQLQAQKNGDGEKSALRELSALEAMIQQMQKSSPASKELEALAAALKSNSETKDAAAALDAGRLAEAAEKLEAAARQQRGQSADEQSAEQLSQAMRDALSRLASNPPGELSKQMQKLAQSGASAREAGEALQRLAQMLRQMAQTPSSSGDGKSQALQNALYSLQNMKYGQPEGKPGGNGKEGGARIVMQAVGGPEQKSVQLAGDPSIPSGQPGSEHDEGTTKTPFGEMNKRNADPGEASPLNGTLGEGESLHDLIPTTGDTSKAGRRYRELYNAMAPAAEDAILQENIPLGSRFFVKRYFENIRPKE